MAFNAQLAKEALIDALASSEYKQNVWRCGTGMCYAGFVVHRAGGRWVYPDINAIPKDAYEDDITIDEKVVLPDGSTLHVEEAAHKLLGLPWDDETSAEHPLFAGIANPNSIAKTINELEEENSK